MKELVFVKLGGSLITDKSRPYTARMDTIERLAGEIGEAREEGGFKLLIGHGGGSFPHTSAKEFRTAEGFVDERSAEGFCRVQDDAAKLNRIVVDSLLKAGIKAVSVQPSGCCVAEGSKVKELYVKPVEMFLESGIVPVVYGDAALDLEKGCCILSTEAIFEYLARKLKPSRIILCGKVDGVLDGRGRVIDEINRDNFAGIKKHLAGSDGIDVTGGMLHKVEVMLGLGGIGVKSEIMNGNKAGNLKKALVGEVSAGTVVK